LQSFQRYSQNFASRQEATKSRLEQQPGMIPCRFYEAGQLDFQQNEENG